ncbi:MAG: hypothetical protein M3O70_12230 [Actinomycetota bacterium]|nr:hypothetical protein [Actinomycetota bacterium]
MDVRRARQRGTVTVTTAARNYARSAYAASVSAVRVWLGFYASMFTATAAAGAAPDERSRS